MENLLWQPLTGEADKKRLHYSSGGEYQCTTHQGEYTCNTHLRASGVFIGELCIKLCHVELDTSLLCYHVHGPVFLQTKPFFVIMYMAQSSCKPTASRQYNHTFGLSVY